MRRSPGSDTEPMTAVLRLYKDRREQKKALRVAQMLVALDQAAGDGRKAVRTRPRATLGRA